MDDLVMTCLLQTDDLIMSSSLLSIVRAIYFVPLLFCCGIKMSGHHQVAFRAISRKARSPRIKATKSSVSTTGYKLLDMYKWL